jgi:hypothetical protein
MTPMRMPTMNLARFPMEHLSRKTKRDLFPGADRADRPGLFDIAGISIIDVHGTV